MSTLNGKSVASTYDQVVKRQDSYSATGNQIEIMDDSGVIKTTPLYLDSVNSRVGIGTASPGALLSLYKSGDTTTVYPEMRLSAYGDQGTGRLATGDIIGKMSFYNPSGSSEFPERASIDVISINTAYWVPATAMRFFTGNINVAPSERMRITSSGNVGIGTDSPGNPLAVNRSGDGIIVDFESADAVEGTVSISGTTTSYNAFVGSHYTQLKDGQNDLPVGAVVSSTGEIITCNFVTEAIDAVEAVEAVEAKDAVLDDDGNITEEAVEAVAAVEAVEAIEATTTNVPNKEYFTYINTTTTQSDPAVYGTWMGKMSDDAKGHSFGDDEKPIYLVAQVGLFKIRVTDTNGNIANGDYLESSTRAMEGQKQTSNAKVNSTIGKAMIDVDWSSIDADSELGYKWKLIPCTF